MPTSRHKQSDDRGSHQDWWGTVSEDSEPQDVPEHVDTDLVAQMKADAAAYLSLKWELTGPLKLPSKAKAGDKGTEER